MFHIINISTLCVMFEMNEFTIEMMFTLFVLMFIICASFENVPIYRYLKVVLNKKYDKY